MSQDIETTESRSHTVERTPLRRPNMFKWGAFATGITAVTIMAVTVDRGQTAELKQHTRSKVVETLKEVANGRTVKVTSQMLVLPGPDGDVVVQPIYIKSDGDPYFVFAKGAPNYNEDPVKLATEMIVVPASNRIMKHGLQTVPAELNDEGVLVAVPESESQPGVAVGVAELADSSSPGA